MISVDWQALYSWPGYDFWGVLLSTLGFAASIFFAATASSRAKVAADAAKNARKSMVLADAASNLNLLQQMLVELRLRVEREQWQQVSEKCEAIRVTLAPLINSETVTFSELTTKSMIGLQSQMASLQKTSDEVQHKEGNFDLVKIKGVLAKQAEALATAIRELRDRTEVNDNV